MTMKSEVPNPKDKVSITSPPHVGAYNLARFHPHCTRRREEAVRAKVSTTSPPHVGADNLARFA
jgi:hypothetical protein